LLQVDPQFIPDLLPCYLSVIEQDLPIDNHRSKVVSGQNSQQETASQRLMEPSRRALNPPHYQSAEVQRRS
jgi:hypothetical protein